MPLDGTNFDIEKGKPTKSTSTTPRTTSEEPTDAPQGTPQQNETPVQNDNKPFNIAIERGPQKKITREKASGSTMQGTGLAMQGAGKAMNAAGSTLTTAGTALSRTGVGAVVGAPMAAAGAVTKGAGKGMDKTGKIVRRTGSRVKRGTTEKDRLVRRFGRNRRFVSKIASTRGLKGAAKLAKVTRATWIACSVCAPFYIAQAGFWAVAIIALGADSFIAVSSKWASYVIGQVPAAGISYIVGTVLPIEETFALGWIISSVISFITLAVATGVYIANGINPFKGAGLKLFGFIFALTLMPLAIIPWVYVWIFIVFKEHAKPKA